MLALRIECEISLGFMETIGVIVIQVNCRMMFLFYGWEVPAHSYKVDCFGGGGKWTVREDNPVFLLYCNVLCCSPRTLIIVI